MSSEGENSKDIPAEVDKPSSENADANNTEDSQNKVLKTENEEKEKSADSKVPSDKPESSESKEKKDADVKKEVKAESSEEVKKEEKEKKNENNESKTDNDTEEGEDSNKDEDGDKKEDKKGVPLLDQPLEQSGSRERKKVQRFNEEFPVEAKEVNAKIEIPSGTGTQLGEIPRIDASISRFKNDDLKLLHRLLYKMTGKTTLIKKNIKKFNGFDFKKDSEEYNKKIDSAKKFEIKQLKSICEMLDLEKKGAKDEIVQRIIDFLLEPKDSGKGGGRPKRTAAVRANNRGYSSHDDSYSSDEKRASRGGRGKGKRSNLKDETTSESDEDFHPSDASESRPRGVKRKKGGRRKADSDDDDDDDDGSEESASSEDSDDEPRKRRKSKKVTNNKAKGRPPGRRGRKPAAEKEKKATPPPTTPKKVNRKHESSEESEQPAEENASSSEDEPLIKKAKSPQPPTDDEIKKYVKEILDGANLEEITMKTVCKQVYAHYPDFDLAHKKDFIKSTVKSLIST